MTIEELEEEIDKLWVLYHSEKNEIKAKPELYQESFPVVAFVLFKGLHDRKRVMNAFASTNNRNWVNWRLESPFKPPTDFTHMYISDGVEPAELKWPNFSVERGYKAFYTSVFYLILISLIALASYLVASLRSNEEVKNVILNFSCAYTQVDVISAALDFASPLMDRNGNFNCFCKKRFAKYSETPAPEYLHYFIFPDGKYHCD